ncbi:hypothetical protein B0T26DRAFT_742173 [Lasiosphaeria miniovina]|uniref:Dehydrogenase FUB6 n=1 Tax=Lasiosphaeria miniovina TaxID=1954250 RepID=A0AA40DS51_9PEZI|nr:uncharacterized protein B0T26DRAFT_742173 [Lasiosphaeria miniovina]KAK0713525.1 hypothetical protein B0T26DRAFT_742173 [Lasiosphaeria miniovina]
MTNKTLILKKIPTGVPVAGEHLVVEDRSFDASAPAPAGGVTLAILYASFDPYLRGKMRDPTIKSYSPPFLVGEPISNSTVARVLKSDTPDYTPGDLVLAFLPIAEYATLNAESLRAISTKLNNPHGLKDLGLFLGPLGMPGLTAWSSFYEIGRPKAGETIFVSSAAGAVGQVVGQIAKREGLRVIGSVGSDEKVKLVTELGFDGAFNYKTEKPIDALARLAPEGIDIYYDNVGGEQLEAALEKLNFFGRIVECGQIAGYNTPVDQRYPIRNLFHVVSKRLTMRGFIVSDPGMGPVYAKDHQEKLGQWLADGSVKAQLSVTEGIDNAADGLIGMLQGKNFGKALVKIANE